MFNKFRTLIHPSSGACDFSIVSPHWLCVLVSMSVGISVWLVGVVSVWQAEARSNIHKIYIRLFCVQYEMLLALVFQELLLGRLWDIYIIKRFFSHYNSAMCLRLHSRHSTHSGTIWSAQRLVGVLLPG